MMRLIMALANACMYVCVCVCVCVCVRMYVYTYYISIIIGAEFNRRISFWNYNPQSCRDNN